MTTVIITVISECNAPKSAAWFTAYRRNERKRKRDEGNGNIFQAYPIFICLSVCPSVSNLN